MNQAISKHTHEHEHHHDTFKLLGFWIFLVTDCIIFACLFAVYAVLRGHTDGDLTGKELFEIKGFTAETFILLTSSFTSGLATLALHKGKKAQLINWLIVTVVLGLAFVGLEVSEFRTMVHEGASISTNGFLSAFFTLVGTHGLHVSFGLIWMTAVILQIRRHGINEKVKEKVTIVGLYWHFLDVVWIFIYTVVYLMGVM
ncbi:cytochrome o quinol oxidase subunit III [Fictibacillus macauensis ZFHKF-1]|uniref:Cytochrome bo(3) ubiquinol oxidase subunit 3 n=1 Tax=Fictibacillus macauensis ZFHKF-1 TaxID=1196324 RepID=I8AMS0_9BACL|nr:cytochrome o ubiquinol oxidase subunit III [Fictibacillus macauensis]EIT86979.1 cytochrome o quinol oxidase subunit III [Fictibacillus macauensis ZFHKF-1]